MSSIDASGSLKPVPYGNKTCLDGARGQLARRPHASSLYLLPIEPPGQFRETCPRRARRPGGASFRNRCQLRAELARRHLRSTGLAIKLARPLTMSEEVALEFPGGRAFWHRQLACLVCFPGGETMKQETGAGRRSEASRERLVFLKDKSRFMNLSCIPLWSALFLMLVFSADVLADICGGVTPMSSESDRTYVSEAPNDPVRYYMAGLSSYCAGRAEEGVNYLIGASNMGHIAASYILGLYYRTDGIFDISQGITKVQKHYNASIFYYERAAEAIASNINYPEDAHRDIPEIEQKTYMSVRTYLSLITLYYEGYSRALGDMLTNNVSYTDTKEILKKMMTVAERCLKRPSLSIWEKETQIFHSKQVICQAQKTFAESALVLEGHRIEAANKCGDTPLSGCNEHQSIIDQLIQISRERGNVIRSVPKI